MVLYMLDHIPAGVNPTSSGMFRQIEDAQDGYSHKAADRYAALIKAVADKVQSITADYEDVSRHDIEYEITSNEFSQGSLILAFPEEAPAVPELIQSLLSEHVGRDYIELRAEGTDISPNYGFDGDKYKYIFHYGK